MNAVKITDSMNAVDIAVYAATRDAFEHVHQNQLYCMDPVQNNPQTLVRHLCTCALGVYRMSIGSELLSLSMIVGT